MRSFGLGVRSRATALAIPLLFGFLVSDASALPSIRFFGGGLDRFVFHGRVRLVPPTLGGPIDPVVDGFAVELSNQYGPIYGASLGPGDLVERRNLRYRFRDKAAKVGAGSRNGLYIIKNRYRQFAGGVWYYTVRVRAYADLSFATESWMTVIFFEVDGPATISAHWVEKKDGWSLPLRLF